MSGLGLILGTTAVLSALGAAERYQHSRALRRIKTRVHVNGTRGKSSVTRLIAAGLRAGGIRTCAKTTGTLARMIMPNGSEYPVYRPSRANVIEQLRIVRTAAELEAEALVIECMAVQPHLQALCEDVFVQSTHGVITNARADHLDVMGPGEVDVALALAATTPYGGTMLTGERRHLSVFEEAAKDRGSRLVHIPLEDVEAISREDLDRFSYVEHAENLALALRVCRELGIDRETALRGMWAATPDPGALTAVEIEFFGRHLTFVNAFAANDPESTGRIWNMSFERYPGREKRIAVVNCRADRPDRSRQLGQACMGWAPADAYVLIGTGTYLFAKSAFQEGLDPGRVVYAEERRVEETFEQIVELAGASALIIGIANIGGPGLDLVRHFRNRSVLGGKETLP